MQVQPPVAEPMKQRILQPRGLPNLLLITNISELLLELLQGVEFRSDKETQKHEQLCKVVLEGGPCQQDLVSEGEPVKLLEK